MLKQKKTLDIGVAQHSVYYLDPMYVQWSTAQISGQGLNQSSAKLVKG